MLLTVAECDAQWPKSLQHRTSKPGSDPYSFGKKIAKKSGLTLVLEKERGLTPVVQMTSKGALLPS
jgi:hypothetical protein